MMNILATMSPRARQTLDDPRWAAMLARDPQADFFYSVKTTGVYCRPSCPARQPKPENVGFHATTEAAEQAGFRPCLRCHPSQDSLDQQLAQKVTRACRILETRESPPPLEELAQEVGLSGSHLHRSFKRITGLTPRAYAAAQRESRMRQALNRAETVTDAIYEAGYGSNSRFYEKSQKVLGMTPSAYRKGGAETSIRFAIGQCSLGAILVAQSELGLCAISLGDDPNTLARELQDRFPQAELVGDDREFCELVARVVGYIEAPKTGLDLPLDIRGTAFQKRVWEALLTIPPGEKLSYSQLAQKLGQPRAVRAVAGACAANTLAVAIPCHRVVKNDGAVSGYRWGVERKLALLDREAGQL